METLSLIFVRQRVQWLASLLADKISFETLIPWITDQFTGKIGHQLDQNIQPLVDQYYRAYFRELIVDGYKPPRVLATWQLPLWLEVMGQADLDQLTLVLYPIDLSVIKGAIVDFFTFERATVMSQIATQLSLIDSYPELSEWLDNFCHHHYGPRIRARLNEIVLFAQRTPLEVELVGTIASYLTNEVIERLSQVLNLDHQQLINALDGDDFSISLSPWSLIAMLATDSELTVLLSSDLRTSHRIPVTLVIDGQSITEELTEDMTAGLSAACQLVSQALPKSHTISIKIWEQLMPPYDRWFGIRTGKLATLTFNEQSVQFAPGSIEATIGVELVSQWLKVDFEIKY